MINKRKGNKPPTIIQQMNVKKQGYKQPLNYNVEKALEPIKIKPKEIFDVVPKGSHRMPDGKIMKNKDMPKKKKKAPKKS